MTKNLISVSRNPDKFGQKDFLNRKKKCYSILFYLVLTVIILCYYKLILCTFLIPLPTDIFNLSILRTYILYGEFFLSHPHGTKTLFGDTPLDLILMFTKLLTTWCFLWTSNRTLFKYLCSFFVSRLFRAKHSPADFGGR